MTGDLREYISKLKKSKDIKIIKKPISLKYEIASVTEKFENSHALLFQNVKGHKFPVVSNLIGTRERFALALGTKMPDIHKKIITAINSTKKPKLTTKAKFFENSTNDTSILPIATHFLKESGPFITSSILHTKNQEKNYQNSMLLPNERNESFECHATFQCETRNRYKVHPHFTNNVQ